jgi:hypothetical protein
MAARPLALAGLSSAVAGTLAVVALHLVPHSGQLNPVRRTISEYALHDTALVFNLGLIALALGSFGVLLALARAGLTRLTGLGGIGLLLWTAGLIAVVYFPKHNWSVGPSANGDIHRAASLIAFVSLPVAAIVIALAFRRRQPAVFREVRPARWTLVFAVLALLCFGVIAGAFILQPLTGVRWWRIIPLGLTERALALFEVATIFALGRWALIGSGGVASGHSGREDGFGLEAGTAGGPAERAEHSGAS